MLNYSVKKKADDSQIVRFCRECRPLLSYFFLLTAKISHCISNISNAFAYITRAGRGGYHPPEKIGQFSRGDSRIARKTAMFFSPSVLRTASSSEEAQGVSNIIIICIALKTVLRQLGSLWRELASEARLRELTKEPRDKQYYIKIGAKQPLITHYELRITHYIIG